MNDEYARGFGAERVCVNYAILKIERAFIGNSLTVSNLG